MIQQKDFDKWIAAYIMFESDPDSDRDGHPLFWAAKKFMDIIHMDEVPEEYFHAILEILRRNPGDEVLSVLAAGPLEDLINHHGHQYIEQIEAEAKRNPKFRYLLGGVWKSDTPEDIWERIERVRCEPW